jgi:hypothetical protein
MCDTHYVAGILDLLVKHLIAEHAAYRHIRCPRNVWQFHQLLLIILLSFLFNGGPWYILRAGLSLHNLLLIL